MIEKNKHFTSGFLTGFGTFMFFGGAFLWGIAAIQNKQEWAVFTALAIITGTVAFLGLYGILRRKK